jgi:hypothetical protein
MRMPVIFSCCPLPTPYSPPLLGVVPPEFDQKIIIFIDDLKN